MRSTVLVEGAVAVLRDGHKSLAESVMLKGRYSCAKKRNRAGQSGSGASILPLKAREAMSMPDREIRDRTQQSLPGAQNADFASFCKYCKTATRLSFDHIPSATVFSCSFGT
jgi:hypothetical protein